MLMIILRKTLEGADTDVIYLDFAKAFDDNSHYYSSAKDSFITPSNTV